MITHNSPYLIDRVDAVFAREYVLILDVDQTEWQFRQGDDLLKAIDWAVTSAGINHVVLIGESTTLGAEYDTEGPSPLAERAKGASPRRSDAEGRFRNQFEQLSNATKESNRILNGNGRTRKAPMRGV